MNESRSVTAAERLLKQPGESRLLGIDFALVLETGEALSAVSGVTALPAGLTLGAPALDGTVARVRVSGGVHNRNYRLQATVTTDAGNTLVGDAILEVRDE